MGGITKCKRNWGSGRVAAISGLQSHPGEDAFLCRTISHPHVQVSSTPSFMPPARCRGLPPASQRRRPEHISEHCPRLAGICAWWQIKGVRRQPTSAAIFMERKSRTSGSPSPLTARSGILPPSCSVFPKGFRASSSSDFPLANSHRSTGKAREQDTKEV